MSSTNGTLFVTGVSGLVGRALLSRLAPRRVDDGRGRRPERVIGLSRNVSAVSESNVTLLKGDLLDVAAYSPRLAEADAVVHVAALTGKARAADYERVNVEGTRALIEAARQAGVRRFFYVSTIAATYPEHDHYPYASSKARAEQLVRDSGLEWSILRPTIVLGRRAPAWQSMLSMAGLPVIPFFGDGTTRVQPILAADLANAIGTWCATDEFIGQELDVGGPEVLTFEELVRRIRVSIGRGRGRVLHLPARLVQRCLALVEPALLPVLPLTAGQLYPFIYDSTAAPNALTERLSESMRDVDGILAELGARG